MKKNINSKKMRFPWMTLIVSALSFVFFSIFQFYTKDYPVSSELLSKLGAPSALEIYDGQYWGIFWNSFLHMRYDLFIVNTLGLWILGAFIERRLSLFRYFLLGLFASMSTSLIQLAFSNDAGVGLAGINFTLFFYIYGRSFKNDIFKLKLRHFIAVGLLITLIYCVYQNNFNGWFMGTAAMISGILIGLLIGLIISFNYVKTAYITMVIILLGLVSTLFYAPWSTEWNTTKAIKYHQKGNLTKAYHFYNKALFLDPNNETAKDNIFRIRIDKLSDKAYKLHLNEQYQKAREVYINILILDPENNWAIEQISNLP